VTEPDRLGQVLVQRKRPRDDASDPGRLERVGHARAVVVTGRVDEDLGLPLQPAERLRVEDPVAVPLERRPDEALLLLALASASLVRPNGERRESARFQLAHPRGKGVGDSPGKLRHRAKVAAAAVVPEPRFAAPQRAKAGVRHRHESVANHPQDMSRGLSLGHVRNSHG